MSSPKMREVELNLPRDAVRLAADPVLVCAFKIKPLEIVIKTSATRTGAWTSVHHDPGPSGRTLAAPASCDVGSPYAASRRLTGSDPLLFDLVLCAVLQ
jgi:hypothetical protein